MLRDRPVTATAPKRILVDNCVLSLGEIARGVLTKTEVPWGNRVETVEIAGLMAKPRFGSDHKWKQDQLECLPTVARLAREGKLLLHKYVELEFEGWQRSQAPASSTANLFYCIPFTRVPSAVERSRIQQMDFQSYLDEDAIVKFCKLLLDIKEESLLSSKALAELFTSYELANIANLRRFREMCVGLAEKQYRDALHLWTAEVAGLDYFLTVDRRFVRAMRESRKLELPCKPLSPAELLLALDVVDRDPLPLEWETVGR